MFRQTQITNTCQLNVVGPVANQPNGIVSTPTFLRLYGNPKTSTLGYFSPIGLLPDAQQGFLLR
jgi:hypothetical protein